MRTWEGAHPSLEQGLEEGKLPIMKMIQQKDDKWTTGWKLLLLYDRLMFARMPAKLRPQEVTATQYRKNIVASGLRRFWRGEWQSLWDEAHITARAVPSDELEGAEELAKVVARIEALGAAQEWGKALKAVDSGNILGTAPCHLTELESKFPPEQVRGLTGRHVDPDAHPEFWDEVARAVKKSCRRLPRKSGPSLDGSRFEHWRAPAALSAYADFLANTAVEFAQGKALPFVYECAKAGRLICLLKGGGGVRPLVITAALRRIALKAVLTVITPSAAEELGPEQFAVGRPNGVVELTHGLEAENAVHGKAVIGFDIANAFGSMSRGAMAEYFMDTFPALLKIVSILL